MLKLLFAALLPIFILTTSSAIAQQGNVLDVRLRNLPITHTHLKHEGSVKQYIDYISRISGAVFEYASNILDVHKVIYLQPGDTTIDDVLREIASQEQVTLIESGNKLIFAPSLSNAAGNTPLSQYTLFGFVQEEGSREPLIGATIMDSISGKGCITNSQGYYSFPISAGSHVFSISYVGYQPQSLHIDLHEDIRKDCRLSLDNPLESATTISAKAPKKEDAFKTSSSESELYNNFLGENDAIRARLLDPGVTSTEDINGMLVRGGDPDQNLFLLDGNEVFNPTHLLGALSIVNTSSLQSMQFYKGDFPARFDGGISSVTDVYTKDGNMERWTGDANLGLLAGSATIEGPLLKNKLAVMASFREGWPNMLLTELSKSYDYSFQDINLKFTYLINNNNKIVVNGYSGKDYMNGVDDNANNAFNRWGNKLASLRWMHIWGARSVMNISINKSRYDNMAGFVNYFLPDSVAYQDSTYNTYCYIDHADIKAQLELFATGKLKFNIGGRLARTRVQPFETNIDDSLVDDISDFRAFAPLDYTDGDLYYENEIRLSKRWFMRPGIHTTFYKFKDYKYASVQPRFFTSYVLTPEQQVFFSYARTGQYLHMVDNPSLGVNNNFWLPSTRIIKPETGTMLNLGYTYKDTKATKITLEAYYKKMNHIINYNDGGNIFYDDSTWETDMVTGKGWSYGLEAQVDKKLGPWWSITAGYSLSWTWRQFDSINNGQKFPYTYDRRHQLQVLVSYMPNKHWNFNVHWTFVSGDAYTPFNLNAFEDNPIAYGSLYNAEGINSARTHPIQRLDIAAAYRFKTRRLAHLITLGFYNISSSPEQYNYNIMITEDGQLQGAASPTSVFGFTPYISYSLHF
jgi:hypothetical protein